MDPTIQVQDTDPSDHKSIANTNNDYLAVSHKHMDQNKLPAYLQSDVQPLQIQPWEVYNAFRRISISKLGGLLSCFHP